MLEMKNEAKLIQAQPISSINVMREKKVNFNKTLSPGMCLSRGPLPFPP